MTSQKSLMNQAEATLDCLMRQAKANGFAACPDATPLMFEN
jgi:hypothetical protein